MNQYFRYIVTALVVVGLLFLAWRFSAIVTYLLIAAVLSLIGHPLVALLDRVHIRKWQFPHVLSALLTLLIIVFAVVSFFNFVVPLIVNQARVLSQLNMTTIQQGLQEPVARLQGFLVQYNLITPDESLESVVMMRLQSIVNMSTFSNFFSNILSITSQLFIGIFSVLFISFFFLKDENLFYNGILLLVPARHLERSGKLVSSIKDLLSRYFIGLMVEVTTMMTLISLGLTLFGIENALLIGFIGGLMNVIPYLGPLIGATVGAILVIANQLGLGDYSGLLQLGFTVYAIFGFSNMIDNLVLQPLIYSSSVKAHPLEIFLVILVAGSLAGVIGMILAIPTYTVFRIIAKEFLSEYRLVQKITERI